MTVDTLKLMLGGEENKSLHAAKLNQIVKKKISYMINEDLDVAKDFLDLVEILKSHKSHVHKALKDDILKRQSGFGGNEVFVENQQQEIELYDENQETIAPVFDGFSNLFWQNDLYRMYKEGQLTKQQLNEMRSQQTQQRKKELDEMSHIRKLQSVTKKERRGELQQQIINDLNKAASDQELVTKWYKAAVIFKACSNLKKAMDQKKEEARYLASVFWIVLKMKMQCSIKLKRKGATAEERLRRMIRNSVCSIGSSVHLRDYTAQKLLVNTLQGLHMRATMKKYIIETGKWVRTI